MGCATSLVKIVVGLFNFIFVIGGIALVALGALFYNGWKNYETILPELGEYQFPPILMMVVGGIVFIIAFMGCCGIVKESKCMMITYASLLLLLLIAEVAIAVLIYTKQDDLKSFLKDGLQKSLSHYGTPNNEEYTKGWDSMQKNLECCGVDGFSDWAQQGKQIPQSCYKDNTLFTKGCVDKVVEELKTEYGMYAAGALAIVELIGIFFGCCLGARFGRKMYHT